ncbi:MAG: DUF4365 domain-containing protein [Gemmatimonadales bacterium]|nr:DUF4365 domain-containing protein [Gemmatimonadales bacterium]
MSPLGPRRGPKKILDSAIVGEQGVTLVKQRVLDMKYSWATTTAAFDVGIDGIIEIRDPATGEALNHIVQVQVKATDDRWPHETATAFEYLCEERDLNHWRRGNAPVVLVVTRPSTAEAYWVDIKNYFKTPQTQRERRVRFNKSRDKFDASSATAVRRASVAPDSGLYVSPLQRAETLYSNLLPVTRSPRALFYGSTSLGSAAAIRQALGENAKVLSEFAFRGKWILSVHDLTAPEWRSVIDRGTVESFRTTEWSGSDDSDRIVTYTNLLQRCVSERLYQLGMRWNKSLALYHFRATPDLSERRVTYQSLKRTVDRGVFKRYETKAGKPYYRHLALVPQLLRLGGEWKLALTPTYYFTLDGTRTHPFYESKLKGIKALENNNAVLGQVAFFASICSDPQGDLFTSAALYPHLGFGPLERFRLEVGIDERTWLPKEREVTADDASAGEDVAEATASELLLLLGETDDASGASA